LEPRNAVEESLDKRYRFESVRLFAELDDAEPVHVVVEFDDEEPYYLRGRGSLADSILFDFFGTAPDPKLAARFADEFLSTRCGAGSIVTGQDVFFWLEADCAMEHEPDGSAGFCTVAEGEGLLRLAWRRLRRR
jgi:hypothetical protein